MKHWLVVCLLFGSVFCMPDTMLSAVVADTNLDNNGIVDPVEITNYIHSFDTDGDNVVERYEFTTKWINTYNDILSNAGRMFSSLDASVDDFLDIFDLALHDANGNFDTDGNNEISVAEYEAFMTQAYTGY